MTLQDIQKLNKGDELIYTGTGFIGFDKSDKGMTFVKKDERGAFDIWVNYQGFNVLVMVHEVELPTKSKQP